MSMNAAQFPDEVWDGLSVNRANRTIDAGPDYEDWDQMTAEMIAVQTALTETPAAVGGAGTVVTGMDTAVAPGALVQVTFTFDATQVPVADHTTSGASGGLKIFDFPEGNLLILGVVTGLSLTHTGIGTGLTATCALVTSLGTATAGADATLTGTEADILASTAATFTSNASTTNTQNTATVFSDGTGGAKDLYLNFACADAGSTDGVADNVVVTGTITITYINLGDN